MNATDRSSLLDPFSRVTARPGVVRFVWHVKKAPPGGPELRPRVEPDMKVAGSGRYAIDARGRPDCYDGSFHDGHEGPRDGERTSESLANAGYRAPIPAQTAACNQSVYFTKTLKCLSNVIAVRHSPTR